MRPSSARGRTLRASAVTYVGARWGARSHPSPSSLVHRELSSQGISHRASRASHRASRIRVCRDALAFVLLSRAGTPGSARLRLQVGCGSGSQSSRTMAPGGCDIVHASLCQRERSPAFGRASFAATARLRLACSLLVRET
jgi:hypothetical protein